MRSPYRFFALAAATFATGICIFSQATPTFAQSTTQTASQIQTNELILSGENLLKASVNIVCLSADPNIPSVSGSGVIIDPRGIILTAAHVAQLFLLQDYLGPSQVECIVRSGSPARRAYLAEPIYVSKTWVQNNPGTLDTAAPTGTGEYDVALLGITGTATSTPLPSTYPYVPLSPVLPTPNEPLAIVSYGAEYLDPTQLNYDLYPIFVFSTISKRYTFETEGVDLFSVVGTAASQEGSSGGGIVNDLGQLIGIITTSSVTGPFADRTLNAVTVQHLRNTYTLDTGSDLDTTLANKSVTQLISNFANESKILGAKVYNDINGASS